MAWAWSSIRLICKLNLFSVVDIFAHRDGLRRLQNNNVYEIYPQSETPQLTKIALINNNAHPHYYGYLSPDKLIWSDLDSDKITVWVWDYRLNASTSFRAHVDVEKFDYYVDVIHIPIFGVTCNEAYIDL